MECEQKQVKYLSLHEARPKIVLTKTVLKKAACSVQIGLIYVVQQLYKYYTDSTKLSDQQWKYLCTTVRQ